MKHISIGVLGACAALLSGCVSLNEGEVSFRRADPPTRYQAPGANSENPNAPLMMSQLIRQHVSLAEAGLSARPIESGTQLSIRLDHGFIDGSMAEIPFTPDRLLNGNDPFIRRGEIVILANAFEFEGPATAKTETTAAAAPASADAPKTNATPPAAQFRFDAASLENARVVYYSNDVQAGQNFNIDNIPLLGPITYHGRPIGIQLTILELDDTSAQMEGLLTKLADIGKSTLSPGGPLTDALFKLGNSLISASSDDVLFRYTMVLDPDPQRGAGAPVVSVLEPGRIVFFRREHRGDAINWSRMRLDHNDGALYSLRDGCAAADRAARECFTPFNGETYLTLNVIDHGKDAPRATYALQSLDDLRRAVYGREVQRLNLTEVTEALKKDAIAQRQQELSDNTAALWRTARNIYVGQYAPLLRDGLPNLEGGVCKGETASDIESRRLVALYDAHAATQVFWRSMQRAFASEGAGANKSENATPEMRQYLLSLVADFALAPAPEAGLTAAELSPSAFPAAFLKDNADALIARLDKAALRRKPSQCPG